MPNGNGTGPAGTGPMTGRGAGYCAGNNAPGWQTPGGGGMQRGFRRSGKPRGFFRSHARHAAASAEAGEIDALHAKLSSLERQLATIMGSGGGK